MKIITLWQPWATLISWKWKTIETRTHNRFQNLVGEIIGIHAGNKWDNDFYELAGNYLSEEQRSEIGMIRNVFDMNLEKGVILCTAKVEATGLLSFEDSKAALIDCDNLGNAANTRYGLFLTDIKPIKHIQIKGHQGIWNYDGEIIYL